MPLNDSIAVAPIDANITAPPSAQYDTMPMTKSFMDNSEFIFSSKDPDAACYKYFAPPKYQMFEWVSWANEYKQNHILTGRIIGITWERTDFHSTTNHERKWLYTLESFDSKGEILDYHFLDECNVYLPVQQK